MPYTLMKGLAWIAMALALGIAMGWLLRSVTAHRQVVRAKSRQADAAELERLRASIAQLDAAVLERDRLLGELAERDAPPAPPTPDSLAESLADAERVLGRTVVLDDLKLITGIGPNVELLCHGIGIRTWLDLSTTEVSLLRTMLRDAGPRSGAHDPTSWPEQARLLSERRWEEFKALTSATPSDQVAD
jgi:predicted flap endonuclease-1-like 5' DNA nuclease